MKKDYSLTIGIPTYNAEKTIEAAIMSAENSAICSNYKLTIIVVDDCSTDNTIKKVHHMQKMFNNIKVFKNSKNTGFPSFGRNKVIKEANSDFISFLDADDIILDCAHKECMDYLYNSELNTAAFRVLCTSPTNSYIRSFSKDNENWTVFSNEEIFKIKRLTCIWNKVWKTDFLKQFEFEECVGEDRLFCYMTYSKDFNIAILPVVGYIHYFRKWGKDSLGQVLGNKSVKKINEDKYIDMLKKNIIKYNVEKENPLLHEILLNEIKRYEKNR